MQHMNATPALTLPSKSVKSTQTVGVSTRILKSAQDNTASRMAHKLRYSNGVEIGRIILMRCPLPSTWTVNAGPPNIQVYAIVTHIYILSLYFLLAPLACGGRSGGVDRL